MEAHIKLASKLYQCRDTAKRLYGEEYPEKLKWYTSIIEGVQKDKGLDTMSAVLLICKDKIVSDNGMVMMLFLAAAVEIMEPSKTEK